MGRSGGAVVVFDVPALDREGVPGGAADRGQGPHCSGPGPEVSAVVLQQALADLNAAYRNFFASVPGRRKGPKAGPGSGPARTAGRPSGSPPTPGSRCWPAGSCACPRSGTCRCAGRPLPPQPSWVTVIKEPRQGRRAAVTARGAAGKTGSSPGAAQRSRKPTPSHAGTRDRPDSPPCRAERKSKRSGDPLPAMRLITYRPHQEGSASNARLRPAFHQLGHDAARVFGVLDQVQHPEQQDCRRLPEIEHLRRPAQNHPGITQVSLEVIGRALRGGLEQRLCVQGFLSRR